MLSLKQTLTAVGAKQAHLARALGISTGTLADLVNHHQWPRTTSQEELQHKTRLFLQERGANDEQLARAFDEVRAPCGNTALFETAVEEQMLLRKQYVLPQTRQHFRLRAVPFTEVESTDDVFMTPDIRDVREAMWHTARHGNGSLVAVVGESGAGKSTLRRELIERIRQESQPILVIEPYVLGMEDNDVKGKTLKATHIAEAIINTVAPVEALKRSPEARFRQLHRILRDSRRAGNSHVLIIEEAHGLSIPTLKHLKRFLELEDGLKRLISIILIGQTELRMRLSETNQEVREVVQRCQLMELHPLNNHLDAYLKFQFERIGKKLAEVMDAGAVEALRAKLTIESPRRGRDAHTVSLLYPLAVANVTMAAMNLAAHECAPIVTADIINEV